MNKREVDYPVELESQFIMRLPEEPAKALKEVLRSGENFKNRLTIQIENDMRHGEVRFDHWLLHAKIVDLPTIVESVKTIDRKSVYKTADICQMMICKHELEQASNEEESPAKNRKKDSFKVDKKFLWPHGVTPPTKNVRKRRFRKTLKKKSMEAPEIEKELKRLLRADNEAVSVSWDIIKEEEDSKPEPSTSMITEKTKTKREHNVKKESDITGKSSKVEDIFGGTLSDSDLDDDNINVDIEDSRLSAFDDQMSDSSINMSGAVKGSHFATQFMSEMFESPQGMHNISLPHTSMSASRQIPVNERYLMDEFYQSGNDNITSKMQQIGAEIEELKQRKQRTQHEIAGMENMMLKQRFLDILQTINKDISYKEMEYQNLQSLLK